MEKKLYNSRKNKTIEHLYISIWVFYSVSAIFLTATTLNERYSSAHWLYEVCSIGTVILLLILFFFVRWYTRGKLLLYIITLLLVFGIAVATRGTNVLIGVMFMLAAPYIDIKKMIHFDMKLKTGMLIIILLLCKIGFLENKVGYAQNIYKQSLGFVNQNNLAAFVCIILLEWLFLCYEKAKRYQFFVILFVMYILNYISKGRTSIYSFIIVFFLFVLANVKPQVFFTKTVKYIFALVTPVLAISCFFMSYLYTQGNAFIFFINQIMTNRIYYASHALSRSGVKLIGGTLVGGITLDMGYVYCAIRFGVLFLIFICLIYSIQFVRFLEQKQINIVLLMLFFVISGLGEGYMFNVVSNISMLYLACANSQTKTDDSSTEVSHT